MLLVSFVYGVAVMSPFNAVISTLDFFTDLMPGYPINFVVSFAINGVMVLVITLCIAYSDYGSHKIKINAIFLLTAIILVALPFLTEYSARYSAGASFWTTCIVLVLMGAMTAVSQSAVIAYMSVISDPSYMAISSVAMGVSALIQNLIRAIILLSIPDQPDLGVLIYYGVSGAILVLAAAMHFVESSNNFA
jgi:hypothetical protein